MIFAPKSALLQNLIEKLFAELSNKGWRTEGNLSLNYSNYKGDQGPWVLQRQSWDSLQTYLEFLRRAIWCWFESNQGHRFQGVDKRFKL